MDAFRGRTSRSGSPTQRHKLTTLVNVILRIGAKRPQLVSTTDLCRRCYLAEAVVESTGFCEACTAAIVHEHYLEQQSAEAEARRLRWQRGWGGERQRRRRLVRSCAQRSWHHRKPTPSTSAIGSWCCFTG
jgi:hypothetical protein